jgi:hypothetical protein
MIYMQYIPAYPYQYRGETKIIETNEQSAFQALHL